MTKFEHRQYRSAIIGLGNIAWRYDHGQTDKFLTHKSVYDANRQTTLAFGFDPNEGSRREFSSTTGISCTNSIEELLDSKPDIVSICSPNATHADYLELCLQAHIPMIWLEKPATTKLLDAERLLRLQKELGCSTVLVGFQRRYLRVYQRLKKLLTSGDLGKLKGLSITYSRGLETNGIHLLDLLFFLVSSEHKYEIVHLSDSNSGTDNPSCLIRFTNGVTCSITGLNLDHHSIDVAVHFSAGRASVLYGGLNETRERSAPNALYPGFFHLQPDNKDTLSQIDLANDMISVLPTLLRDLIDADTKQRDPISSLNSSLAAQRLLDRMQP